MIKIPYEEIIEKIITKTGKSKEDIESMIKQKQNMLSGLITEQGAAQIIASEFGINIYEEYSGKVKINKIIPGMKNIEVLGKIMNIYPIKEFTTKEGRKGKVASIMLGDETGRIRLTLWNDLTELLKEVKEEDIILLKNAGSKQNQERVELQIFSMDQVTINPRGVDVNVKETYTQNHAPAERREIKDIIGNEENIYILGNIVSVYDPRFFETCPECGKRVREEENYKCLTHGEIQPKMGAVLNIVVDDGTGTIRCSLFTNQINKLIEFSGEKIENFKEKSFEDIKDNLLGEFVKIIGKSIKSEAFDRIELRAQVVFLNPNPEREMEKIN